jgi:uncharacterized protein (DUF1501 family)
MNIPHSEFRTPHWQRRDLLRLAAAGAFTGSAVSWLDIVAGRGLAQAAATGRKHKSCIVLFMSGGPSHAHTFDLKPKSSYQRIQTSAPGIEISEYLPEVAKQMHHMSLVRSMSTVDANHETAHFLMRTGFRQGTAGLDYPHFGAMAAKELVREDSRMPNFIVLKPGSGSRQGHSAGFIGAQYAPMTMKDVSAGIANLAPPGTLESFDRRAALLEKQDQRFLADRNLDAAKAKIESYRKTIDLVHYEKAKLAFEVDREPDAVKNRYGEGIFAKQCLGARRLVEAGVPFVEVMHPQYWDTHGGADQGQKKLSEVLDRPMAALLEDLAERGLLESTLVVWMGEFGRDFTGNGHYAKAWTVGFAGAGIAGGRVIGKTDDKAMTVVDRPVKVGDFVATIYKALGIDYAKEIQVDGRPVTLTDKGKPVDELFG